MSPKEEASQHNSQELRSTKHRGWQDRRISRRDAIRFGLATGGALALGLYVKPNLKSVGIPAAYAAGSPGPTPTPGPCANNSPPTVTVTRPNGGESWRLGQTQAVEWSAYDFDGVTPTTPLIVSIHYDANSGNDGFPYVIATGIVQTSPGYNQYAWYIPRKGEPGYDNYLISSKARIRVTVTDICRASASDMSDGDFCPPDPSLSEKFGLVEQAADGAMEFRYLSIMAE